MARLACLLLAAVAHAAQKPTCKPVVWANARFEFSPEASPAAASPDPPLSFCQMYADQTCCNRVSTREGSVCGLARSALLIVRTHGTVLCCEDRASDASACLETSSAAAGLCCLLHTQLSLSLHRLLHSTFRSHSLSPPLSSNHFVATRRTRTW
jgi:hypothetical protein